MNGLSASLIESNRKTLFSTARAKEVQALLAYLGRISTIPIQNPTRERSHHHERIVAEK